MEKKKQKQSFLSVQHVELVSVIDHDGFGQIFAVTQKVGWPIFILSSL